MHEIATIIHETSYYRLLQFIFYTDILCAIKWFFILIEIFIHNCEEKIIPARRAQLTLA